MKIWLIEAEMLDGSWELYNGAAFEREESAEQALHELQGDFGMPESYRIACFTRDAGAA